MQTEASVQVIVGKTFDEEILNSKKDVVLEVCEVLSLLYLFYVCRVHTYLKREGENVIIIEELVVF